MNNDDEDLTAVARALRALPELAPPADGWARLARRLGRRPASARPAVAFAIAAGTLAVIALTLWPLWHRLPAPGPAPLAADPAAGAAPDTELAARAAGLERLLEALPPSRAARAGTALTTTLLEDRIALVDERLSTVDGQALPPAATRALLEERVVLLDSLVRVRYAASVGQTL